MQAKDHTTQDNFSEFEDMKIAQDENPVDRQVPKTSGDFANQEMLQFHLDYLLQPLPRQPGWPPLSPEQIFMMDNLSVSIFKTVDENLSDLHFKITGLSLIEPGYKLAVFLFSGAPLDLCDFEVKDPKPLEPKIDLDSIVHDIKAIVLLQLKPPQQVLAGSIPRGDANEEINDDATVTEDFSSDDDKEEVKDELPQPESFSDNEEEVK